MAYSRSQLFAWQWADTQRTMADIIRLVTDPEYARRRLAAADHVSETILRAKSADSAKSPPTSPSAH